MATQQPLNLHKQWNDPFLFPYYGRSFLLRQINSNRPKWYGKHHQKIVFVPDTKIGGDGKKSKPEQQKSCNKQFMKPHRPLFSVEKPCNSLSRHRKAANEKRHKDYFRTFSRCHKIQQYACCQYRCNQSAQKNTFFHNLIRFLLEIDSRLTSAPHRRHREKSGF